MGAFWQNIRYGLRMLARSPGFTAVAVLTLALGIGANTAIFSVVNAVLLRPLPYKDPDRLVRIWETRPGQAFPRTVISQGEYLTWREQARSFEQLAIIDYPGFSLSDGGEPEQTPGAVVTTNFFEMLGIAPALGRSFAAGEGGPGHERVAILSYALWQRHFGGAANALGKTIHVDGKPYTVIGVMPRGFGFGGPTDIWVPFEFAADEENRWSSHYLEAYGRLRPGVSMQQAESELNSIARNLQQQRPLTNTGHGAALDTLQDFVVGNVRQGLLALLGTVGLVLLIACVNVANLQLSRAAARRKEMAIRTALGASRRRVIGQLLGESMLLAIAGGVLGFLCAVWGVGFLVKLTNDVLPLTNEIRIDGAVLGFTLALSLFTGIILGLVPAFQASRVAPSETLKESGWGLAHASHRRMYALVTAEIGLALVVLVGAGLLTKSFVRLRQVNLGFNPQHLLTMNISLSGSGYMTTPQEDAFYGQLIERLESLPGVRSVAAVDNLPLGGSNNSGTFTVEGRPPEPPGHRPSADRRVVTPRYFEAMGIPLLRGREFNGSDRAGSPLVGMINETLARRFFPGQDPVGKRLRRGGPEANGAWLEIVGVVGDVRDRMPRTEPRPEIYLAYSQFPYPADQLAYMTLVIRSAGDPAQLTDAARAQVRAISKEPTIAQILPMENTVAGALGPERLPMFLFGGFAVVALVLATVGIYGVVAYSVVQRTHEIGIRMALGAQPRDVLRLVVAQGLRPAVLGVGLGLAAAFVSARAIASMLFGVSPADAMTFAAVAVLLLGVALFACWVPARRAMRVDPMVALRYE